MHIHWYWTLTYNVITLNTYININVNSRFIQHIIKMPLMRCEKRKVFKSEQKLSKEHVGSRR